MARKVGCQESAVGACLYMIKTIRLRLKSLKRLGPWTLRLEPNKGMTKEAWANRGLTKDTHTLHIGQCIHAVSDRSNTSILNVKLNPCPCWMHCMCLPYPGITGDNKCNPLSYFSFFTFSGGHFFLLFGGLSSPPPFWRSLQISQGKNQSGTALTNSVTRKWINQSLALIIFS